MLRIEKLDMALLTRLDMARVIVTAMLSLPSLVAADHPEVVRRMGVR